MEERQPLSRIAEELEAEAQKTESTLKSLKAKVGELEAKLKRLRSSRATLLGDDQKKVKARRTFRPEELKQHLEELLEVRSPQSFDELIEALKSRARAEKVSATGIHAATKRALSLEERFEDVGGSWRLQSPSLSTTVGQRSLG